MHFYYVASFHKKSSTLVCNIVYRQQFELRRAKGGLLPMPKYTQSKIRIFGLTFVSQTEFSIVTKILRS